ncbi:hypothetical protein AMECASPLE_034224 [Ameca splendens]|uniref:Uncharacterized protein n=1 Tax=Ameca splendens TaxID=208324 RepID=A0ABV0Y7E1_9TELE
MLNMSLSKTNEDWKNFGLNIGFSLFPLLLSAAPFESSPWITCLHPIPSIFLCHTNPLHILFRYIHKPPLLSSFDPPVLQLQVQHSWTSVQTLPPLSPNCST